jgi:hypothetical protein
MSSHRDLSLSERSWRRRAYPGPGKLLCSLARKLRILDLQNGQILARIMRILGDFGGNLARNCGFWGGSPEKADQLLISARLTHFFYLTVLLIFVVTVWSVSIQCTLSCYVLTYNSIQGSGMYDDDEEDAPQFSCRAVGQSELHTHGFLTHMLYNLGTKAMSGRPSRKDLNTLSAARWNSLKRPAVTKVVLKICIPARQVVNM